MSHLRLVGDKSSSTIQVVDAKAGGSGRGVDDESSVKFVSNIFIASLWGEAFLGHTLEGGKVFSRNLCYCENK